MTVQRLYYSENKAYSQSNEQCCCESKAVMTVVLFSLIAHGQRGGQLTQPTPPPHTHTQDNSILHFTRLFLTSHRASILRLFCLPGWSFLRRPIWKTCICVSVHLVWSDKRGHCSNEGPALVSRLIKCWWHGMFMLKTSVLRCTFEEDIWSQ